jgi:acetyl esterase/lipase
MIAVFGVPAMRFLFAAIALTLVLVPAWPDTPATPAFTVKEVHDLAYRDAAPGETIGNHNRLDLYLPDGAKDFPVVLIVHGGAWMVGDKNWDSIPNIGRTFAKQGIGAVGINYRLSPTVQHPTHIQDVASAFAWVHKHIGEYGGRSDKFTIMGHSAGGHLVALLATDDSYLKAVGLCRQNIQAVIGVSGVYQISEMGLNAIGRRRAGSTEGSDTPFERIFGKEPNAAHNASPLAHMHTGLPPFLLVYAEKDMPTLGLQAMAMNAALKANNCDSTLLKVDNRSHVTVMWKCSQADDPVMCAAMSLIRKTTSH